MAVLRPHPGGTRFSPLTRITRDNVAKLVVTWRYQTGEPALDLPRQPSLQVTPIVVDNVMYISTPLGKVMALEPATGREIWRFDARVNPKAGYGDFASRGVSTWLDTTLKPGAPCRRRIYVATMDARLISLDAASGYPCVVFGIEGTIGLREALRVRPAFPTAYEVTRRRLSSTIWSSRDRPSPTIPGRRRQAARCGPSTHEPAASMDVGSGSAGPERSGVRDLENGSAARTGAANVWSVIAADPQRDLVFLPTSSAAPDYFGGLRLGDNRYANSIVALRASTGRGRLALPDGPSRPLGLRQRFSPGAGERDARRQDDSQPSCRRPRPENCSCCIARPACRCFRSRSVRCPRARFPAKKRRRRNRSPR